jgi:hypothetical protein
MEIGQKVLTIGKEDRNPEKEKEDGERKCKLSGGETQNDKDKRLPAY